MAVEETEEAPVNTETIHGHLMKRSSRKLHQMSSFSKQGDLWRFTIRGMLDPGRGILDEGFWMRDSG